MVKTRNKRKEEPDESEDEQRGRVFVVKRSARREISNLQPRVKKSKPSEKLYFPSKEIERFDKKRKKVKKYFVHAHVKDGKMMKGYWVNKDK